MKNFLEIAIKASIEAGIEILNVYDSEFSVQVKSDQSPLTIADENANKIINRYLKTTNVPIISEENIEIDYKVRSKWKHCWIVDPLDGTKEFIKRNGEFTVNIAYVSGGDPVLGVIFVPVTKTLYYADVAGKKAFKCVLENFDFSMESISKLSTEIMPSNDENLKRIVGSRSHLSIETKEFIDQISQENSVEIVSKGSSLKFCLIAEGKADLYPRYAPTMEWDTAAGQAICMAVGVTVNALPNNTPLKYNKENLLNPWFLVSNRN
ncbi:3'(2'),5'-bisphosphate nucleotidase CysQ [Cochleicola gelatinilyticus]|uniref:3'(2'),5'-bisphosphate nucleotidase CysQ n=1 Tax=Cochleicola gelatinilyticus TaxID=1763537 RepID=A0A167G944_9FLAO|nr:3'(2'),5'-bisphosphate nucleotidase CysQ [Cochleicola gelatinilyticus]OAB77348.1 3'(2'),5'-bisphosphate nucleotidase CysQ [Cochleicola gelatinilyticus]